MKNLGIQRTILLAVLLPSVTIAIAVAAYFTFDRIRDSENAWRMLGYNMARNLATSSEYAIVTGNRPMLATLAHAAAKEPGVRFVMVKDEAGQPLSWSGMVDHAVLMGAGEQDRAHLEAQWIISLPVELRSLNLNDPMLDIAGGQGASQPPKVIGTVLLGMSTDNLEELKRHLLLAGLLIMGLGTILAGVIAVVVSRTLSRPILALSQVVGRLGGGELAVRAEQDTGGEIGHLQAGVNRMAVSLEQHNSLLQQRVREATEDLERKRQEAEQANLAKSRFLASVSHDLRQPMHALGLFTELLHQQLTDDQHLGIVQRMQASVSQLEGMFNALLDLSKLDAGAVQPNFRDFDLKPYLRKLDEEFAPLAEEKGIALRVRLASAGTYSDSLLLARILNNLVANAIHYTQRGGVLVACRRRHDHWLLQVWDTGIGIAPEDLPRIFEEYYQVGNPERNRRHGMGLGLAIVAKLARLLGHELQVHSRPGRGTVFSLKLPVAPLALPEASPSVLPPPTASFSGQCVLVIDDDPDVLDSMAALLSSWGLRPLLAPSLDAVWPLLETGAVPDAVVSDFRLPGEADGLVAIERLRERFGAELPAALISGDTVPQSVARMNASGLTILHKPVAPARLHALLTGLLTQR
ncbi:signal transduction histidine kinase [Sulfuritortus calidifontis]|uniref:histidine kinase n=1 Tax=Sulfuritortus calidifontis TaxID=1914471 RepID=A0A4R3JXD1_9PROT|nr:hybrid sensor histidine kinase/response regulator [Sulfuritortus calidifontis]TCS73060.1 signal transduction histidine kinase [Sulfuritortus calidifontis]